MPHSAKGATPISENLMLYRAKHDGHNTTILAAKELAEAGEYQAPQK